MLRIELQRLVEIGDGLVLIALVAPGEAAIGNESASFGLAAIALSQAASAASPVALAQSSRSVCASAGPASREPTNATKQSFRSWGRFIVATPSNEFFVS